MGDRATEYLLELQGAIEQSDAEAVIGVSTQLLNFIPNDPEVRLCRAIAYLQNDQFQEALSDVDQLKSAEFERCLCLYGLGRFADCLKRISALPAKVADEERWRILREQIYIRLYDSQSLRDLYSKFPPPRDISEDQAVNRSAGLALTGDVSTALALLNESSPVEQLYNTAVCVTEFGDPEKASELVELGLTKEMSPMYNQLFRLLKANLIVGKDPAAAAEEFQQLADAEDGRPYVRSIAAANYASLTLETSVQAARKRVPLFEDGTIDYKTYRARDVQAFLATRLLVMHKIGQPGRARQVIELARKYPGIPPLLVESFERTIDPNLATKTQFSPVFIAQALIGQNKFEDAALVLARSPLATHPRTIAVVSDLFVAAQKPEAAVKYFRSVNLTTPGFLNFAAKFAYRHGFPSEASYWADKLSNMDRSPEARALQAFVLKEADIDLAERHISRLIVPSIPDSELDALEATPVAREGPTETTVEGQVETVFEAENPKRKRRPLAELSPEKQAKRKEKKRRRRRLQKPRNYDPARRMDPLRWKPKNERGGKKKKKQPTKALISTVLAPPKPPPRQQKPGKRK
jgi:tetratricopeptide (TPR) repeat protein